jgi:hypothetical protein
MRLGRNAGAATQGTMTRRFTRFACIDWSGAVGPWQPGIAVAICVAGDAAPTLLTPPGRHWSRTAMRDWLLAQADAQADMLIGIDFSTALPFDPVGGYLPGVAGMPRDARGLWRHVDEACANDPHLAASSFVRRSDVAPHFRVGAATGSRFADPVDRNGRLRVVERHAGCGHPASCFNLVGASQVGLSSLTGMRVLHQLGGRIPIWPFDARPRSGPLIVEIYTSIAAIAAGRRRGASKMRTGAALDAALAHPAIRSAPLGGHAPISDHASDALLTAAWLRRAADDPALWTPVDLTPALAATEGWTFGLS